MKADVQTIDAKKAGSVELADHIFGLEPRVDIIHRVIQWQLNKRQQGTHQAKSRGEINRTTKKLGNQKGGGTRTSRFAQGWYFRRRRQGLWPPFPQP